MNLLRLRQDLSGARRATSLLLVLLVTSMTANLILTVSTVRLVDRERIVIVPPTIEKTFWVTPERVSPEYLEQMGYFLLQLVLNVTPQSVDHQSEVLLRYATPAAAGELRAVLTAAAERLKRDGAATLFGPRDLIVDAPRLRIGVRGQLTTYIGERRVSDTPKGYALEFGLAGGRIVLKAFRETDPNDPLETRRPGDAAGA